MKNLTIGRRLGAGFLVVVLAMVALVVVGVTQVNKINDKLAVINDVNAVKQRFAINFRGSVHDRAIALRDLVYAADDAGVAEEKALIADLAAKYSESDDKMNEIFKDPTKVHDAERAALADINKVQERTLPLIEEITELREKGQTKQAVALLNSEAKGAFVDWLRVINVFIDMEEAQNKVETTEARGTADGFLMVMALLLLAAVAIAIAVAWHVTRSITRPLGEAVDVMAGVAEGDLTRRLDVRSSCEVGQMGNSINAALDSMGAALGSLATGTETLAATTERMGRLSNQLADGAQQSSTQADLVASSADEVSRNVHTVAAGSEEMGASIREISSSAAEAATVAGKAVVAVQTTTASMSRLGDSSREIGDVVKTITSIAEQTNLLALNATIEAARAGDAGKGFAVVASEVKDLAQETARATEDIHSRVDAIQHDTGGAVEVINRISEVIAQINDFQTTIASAVEEQTATTGEMSRSIAEVAAGSQRIAANISDVSSASAATVGGVTQTREASTDVSRTAEELRTLVGAFRF